MNIKKILPLMCSASLLFAMTGCSDKAESSSSSKDNGNQSEASSVTAQEILTDVKDKFGGDKIDSAAFFTDDLFKKNCKKLYATEYEKLSDGGIIYAGSGGWADEVSLIKPADGDYDRAVNALEARRDMRITDFTGYKPDEISKIESCEIFVSGDYAVLIISDDASDIAQEIKSLT